eukprot:tig00020943_g16334.t1
MGCKGSKSEKSHKRTPAGSQSHAIKTPPSWKSDTPLSRLRLKRMREEFWDTRVEGHKETWDTLKGIVEFVQAKDLEMANVAAQSAGIVVPPSGTLNEVYDALGVSYKLPPFVISDPSNIAPDTLDDGTTRDDMKRSAMV